MEVLIWLNLDKLIHRIFFPLPQPRQKRNEKKAYEKTRNSFRWITLRECSSGCLVGIFFIGVLKRGELENWTCKNSPLFSGSPKSFAAKADFVLCLASHFHTTRQFLHFYIFTILYNGCLLPFYNPFFSLSQRYLLSLAKEQIDNTAAFSPSQRKTWRSRVFSLLKELDIFLSSQGKGDFSHFTFFLAHRGVWEKKEENHHKPLLKNLRWSLKRLFNVWSRLWDCVREKLKHSRTAPAFQTHARRSQMGKRREIHRTSLTNPCNNFNKSI